MFMTQFKTTKVMRWNQRSVLNRVLEILFKLFKQRSGICEWCTVNDISSRYPFNTRVNPMLGLPESPKVNQGAATPANPNRKVYKHLQFCGIFSHEMCHYLCH